MSSSEVVKWVAMAALVVAGFVLGSSLGAFEDGEIDGRTVIAIGAISVIVILPATWYYWSNLDELAREAHKSAWNWGGSIGMLIVFVPMICLIRGVERGSLDFEGLDPGVAVVTGFSAGAGVVIFGAVGGYVIAWIIYWLRKR